MVVVAIKLAHTTATTSLLGEAMPVVRILRPELLASVAYGFVGDDDPTCKQQLFIIAIAIVAGHFGISAPTFGRWG
jgi:hypothetical protein